MLVERIAGMDQDQQRLFWQQKMVVRNRRLKATAQGEGVVKPRDFAVVRDHGYRGLHSGETVEDIRKRIGLQPCEPILD